MRTIGSWSPIAIAVARIESYRRFDGPLIGRRPARFKASMLREILESELDVEMKRLLVNVVETYFKLDTEQKEELRRLLATEEYREMQDYRDDLFR